MLSLFLNDASRIFKYTNIPGPLVASLLCSRRAFMLVNMSTPEPSDSAYRERNTLLVKSYGTRDTGNLKLTRNKMKLSKLSV